MKIKKESKLQLWSVLILFIIGLLFGGPVSLRANAVEVKSKSELVEKEDIDVVIKYIDLTDENLKREGIPQIKKDEDNGELKYAVRSVLKNLSWVRYIYIVMPNEKVRYFKDKDAISDKIKYIKDKDVLGFDSASSVTFEFNFGNLKKFGVSENFIYMNDDYFIGKKLKKSDFFYEENGKIVPYVIYNQGIRYGQKKKIQSLYSRLQYVLNAKDRAHSGEGFLYQRMSSLMFLYNLFDGDIRMPSEDLMYFPHNALGENLTDLQEIHDVVRNKYKYADSCLKAKRRENRMLQPQTLYSFYALNKHNRRVNRLRGDYIDLASAMSANYNIPLFCINTGGNFRYTDADYARARVIMNKLFPKATEYEIPELQNGTYVISSALDSNKVMDVQMGHASDETNIHLWSKNGTNAQKFKVMYQIDGSYVISPLCSGKRVDVCMSGTEIGTNIWQYSKNGSKAQKWYMIPAGNGYFNIVSACNNLCADIDNASTADGTNIRCWEPNGTNAQKFKFEKVG